MADNDLTETIGRRGQSIVEARLLDLGTKGRPLFRPVLLGDKWPATDLYVELLDSALSVTPFFFLQVKSTNRGYNEVKDFWTANHAKPKSSHFEV